MSKILVVNSSVSGPQSVSRLLVDEAVEQIKRRDPNATVIHRELAAEAMPHLAPETVAGLRAEATTDEEHASRAFSDTLITELKEADTLIIGAPMYNFSIPSTLKAWFDHIIRPGVTFSYSEAGPKGLMSEKSVIIVTPRGGYYSEGSDAESDFQEPYLRRLLAFIGLTDVRFIRAEKLAFGPEAVDEALKLARVELASLA